MAVFTKLFLITARRFETILKEAVFSCGGKIFRRFKVTLSQSIPPKCELNMVKSL